MQSSKWNSRHVIIGSLVLILMFILRFNELMLPAEIALWYDTVRWLVGIIIGGHALNKWVDAKPGAG